MEYKIKMKGHKGEVSVEYCLADKYHLSKDTREEMIDQAIKAYQELDEIQEDK